MSVDMGGTLVQLLWEIIWNYLLKLNLHIPHDIVFLLRVISSTEIHTHMHQETHKNVHSSMFVVSLD